MTRRERSASFAHTLRRRVLLMVLVLLVVSGLTFDPKLYISGDNVDYLVLAQRVLRDGELWGSAKFPPLFPLLLAPLQFLFGPGFLAAKILVVLTYAAAGGLLLALAERALTPAWAFAVTLGAITILPVVEFSHYVMSEIPFLCVATAALLLGERTAALLLGERAATALLPGERADDDRASPRDAWRQLLPFTLAAAAAFYLRTIGIALLAAMPLLLLARRRWPLLLVSLLLTTAALMPWLLHSALSSAEETSYLDQIRYVNPYLPERGLLDPSSAAQRVAANGRHYFGVDIPLAIAPHTYSSTYAAEQRPLPQLPAWGAAGVFLLLAAALIALRRRLPLTTAYAALFLAVCLAWPPIWAGVRLILPLLPICFLALLAGAVGATEAVAAYHRRGPRPATPPRPRARPATPPRPAPAARYALAAALAVILLMAGANLLRLGNEVRRYPTRWEAYFNALEWARLNLPRDEIVLDRKPNVFEYMTGLRATAFPREPDDGRMVAALQARGVTVVHVSSIPYEDVLEILHPFVQRQQARFEPLWYEAVEGGGFGAFLRFHADGAPEAAP